MNKKIVLISCGKKKLPKRAKARDLYTGPLFKHSLKYAEGLQADHIFILSGKHGLLKLDDEIDPYEKNLNKLPAAEIRQWAGNVLDQLRKFDDLDKIDFVILAGKNYRKYLVAYMKNPEIPLQDKRRWQQIPELKKLTKTSLACKFIHESANALERHKFPFDTSKMPLNGVYFLFQKGEKGHQQDRIVRIGTHTGVDQLHSRLAQHFLNSNKDRSIFRKNIGRALLNQENDPFLKCWEYDLTSRAGREQYSSLVDSVRQKEIECKVCEYICSEFSFSVFELKSKVDRLRVESRLISTLALCEECGPSKKWLGNFSPKDKIVKSGLWLVNGLNGEPYNETDIAYLSKLIHG